jgi:citrate/tricarballylate utilization protein
LLQALRDALTLRYLGGHDGGAGCNDRDERFTQTRRRLHHALFYGFLLCFASTCVAALYEHVLGRLAPYPLLSPPVLLGALGGAGMMIGAGGLVWLKVVGDPVPAAPGMLGADFALLFLLLLTAATGLLLLALRETGAMGVLLAVHLGCVLAFFLAMPYSRFVHGPYRLAALLRHALERPAYVRARGAGA